MILPTLISVSVAPGSYFFCAPAVLATDTARSPASAADLTWLKTRWCIIVLPDVLAEAQAVLLWGSLMSRRMECRRSMHDWGDVASDAFAAIFRTAEETNAPGSSFKERASEGPRARTVKRGACKPIIVKRLRTKAKVHESSPEGALVYRKPPCRQSLP